MATPKSKKPSKGAPKPPFYLPKKGAVGKGGATPTGQGNVPPGTPQTGKPQYPAKPLPSSKVGPKASTGKQSTPGGPKSQAPNTKPKGNPPKRMPKGNPRGR